MSAVPYDSDRFRDEALFYSDWTEFVSGTVPFIKDGINAGEPVLLVESPEKIRLLQAALGDDTEKVLFADMGEVGANPARIIPAWRDFVSAKGANGKRLRGIGEPIWNGRTADELVECQRHESLLNVAFAAGQPWWLLCPYDVTQLDDSVLDEARRSHEYLMDAGGRSVGSDDFRGVDASGGPFDVPFSEPKVDVQKVTFDRERLLNVRAEVIRFATTEGLSTPRAKDFVTAVNEIATNSIVHGGGKGTMRMWRDGDTVTAEICDSGAYALPLADRERPGLSTGDARGLWLANNVCDLVQIRTLDDGTAVRLHMKVDPRRHLRVISAASGETADRE